MRASTAKTMYTALMLWNMPWTMPLTAKLHMKMMLVMGKTTLLTLA